MVISLIAPAIVHGHTQFPIFLSWTGNRDALLWSGVVSESRAKSRVDDEVRIVAEKLCIQFSASPLFGFLFPNPVEPVQIWLVLGGELGQLGKVEIRELLESCGIIFVAEGIAGLSVVVRM